MPLEPIVSLGDHAKPSSTWMAIVITRWCENVDDRRARWSYNHAVFGVRADCDDITGPDLTALSTQRHFEGALKHNAHLLVGVIVGCNDACRASRTRATVKLSPANA